MRKALGFTSLLIASVALILVMGPSCKAEDTPAEEGYAVKQAANAMPIQVQSGPAQVKIHIQRRQKRIFVTPPYVSICNSYPCAGEQFEWEIVGGLEEGEKLVIKDAPGTSPCFSMTIPVVIEPPYNGAGSDLPDEGCQQEELGHFWPYLVHLTLADGSTIGTDPGGIIHKRK